MDLKNARFSAFPIFFLFFGRLCFARMLCQTSLKYTSVCACVVPGHSPTQLLHAVAIFNISCNSENGDQYVPNLSRTFGNLLFACACVVYEFRLRKYYDFQYNLCRTSDHDFSLLLPHTINLKLSEIPGVHRSSAYAKCETLCLPQHSVQWLHARKTCSGA
jgi:hypothetical protein